MTNNLKVLNSYGRFTGAQQRIIDDALELIGSGLQQGQLMDSAAAVKTYCQLQLSSERDEQFCCLFLSSQHHLIAFERLFSGTLDAAAVYPRVVVRRCLEINAAAIILAHNHPSGVAEPSQADRRITERLQKALGLVDIRVLDHLVVGSDECTSFAERGWL